MIDLFGNEVKLPNVKSSLKNKDGSLKYNPCIDVYGPGPDGEKCKNCKHLYYKKYSGKYFKCDLRKNTNSPASDHRANFPSCSKFEKDQPGHEPISLLH